MLNTPPTPGDHEVAASIDGRAAQAFHQRCAGLLDPVQSGGVIAGEFLQRCNRGGHQRNTGIVGAGMVHGAGAEELHEIAPPGQRRDRETGRHRLREGRQIARVAKALLRAAESERSR